ncbi:MAG TPA: aldehyde dehydrogenase family protein, partial [Candidatus Limnocylindrales bacterium]|nr:aldehyde dehydrogenase family protein [Candidatus Limnocylindrales bacterium]
MSIQSVNPATGQVVETFEPTSPAALERVLTDVHEAFLDWRHRSFEERATPMRAVARLLRERRAQYARTMAIEMGKPAVEGEAEIDKCALTCDHYAEHAAALLAPEPHPTEAQRSYVRFDPLGVV